MKRMSKNTNILTIITVLIQSLLITLIIQIIFATDDLNTLKGLLPLASLIILVLTILVIFSIREIEDNVKREIEMKLLKTHLEQIEALVMALQTQKHEYTRHIQTIQAMLYIDELSSAKDYINGISKNYHDTGDMIYVGNPALTVLLNSKRKVAESLDIIFDFAIKCDIGDIKISSWDLCSIIGNLLDNAFEAVSGRRNSRNVGLEIKFEDKKYKIYVYNNGSKISPGEQNLIFKEGYTTKNSKARGYGLYIVKSLVDQYKGEIEIKSGKKTAFIVGFPMGKKGV